MKESIGFVGLGAMGSAMASNLLKAGIPVNVYNRTDEKAQSLAAQGAIKRSSPAETVSPGGIVFSMVSNDQAIEEVTFGETGILNRLGEGGVHVSMSTISPKLSRRLTQLHQEAGGHYLASPVFGKPKVAALAKLWICVAGNSAAKARVLPLQNLLGQKIFDVGEDPGAAAVVKLAGNFLIGSAIEAMAEAFTLAQKNGVPRTQVYELFTQSLFACFIYQQYGELIAANKFDVVGAKPTLIRKDFGMLLEAARDSLVPMPLAELVHDRLTAMVAKGRDELDWAGFSQEVSEAAGL